MARGNAEEGGLGEQRTLMVGGPLHGTFKQLASGQKEYRFVSTKMLSSGGGIDGDYPDSAEHIYKYDRAMTEAITGPLRNDTRPTLIAFSHPVLYGQVEHGAFIHVALAKSAEAVQGMSTQLKRATDEAATRRTENGDLRVELQELRSEYDELDGRMAAVRTFLEAADISMSMAIGLTGYEYSSES